MILHQMTRELDMHAAIKHPTISLLSSFLIVILSFTKMAASGQEMQYKTVAGSCHGFSSSFYKELSLTVQGNIISSPLSVHMILSLLSHGASNKTLEALTAGLQHGDTEAMNNEFQSLMTSLNNAENIKLYIANAMYVQDGVELGSEFLSIGKDIFQSFVSSLDFKNSADAAGTINDWVNKATESLISDVVSQGDFDEYTRLVLVNAIYFKGRWLHEFQTKNTVDRPFHTLSGHEKLVPTMYRKASFQNGELPTLQAKFIEIPYLNQDIAMIVILPNELDGLLFVQNNFEWKLLLNATVEHEEVELRLPKFKFEASISLNNILSKLGMSVIFQHNADFSRLAGEHLQVSKVMHKAVIDVSESGTEAAAVTVVHLRSRRMIIESPKQFNVDRPFMFIIEHKPSRLPLFVGSVRDIGTASKKDEL